jgi:hypothetical protein
MKSFVIGFKVKHADHVAAEDVQKIKDCVMGFVEPMTTALYPFAVIEEAKEMKHPGVHLETENPNREVLFVIYKDNKEIDARTAHCRIEETEDKKGHNFFMTVEPVPMGIVVYGKDNEGKHIKKIFEKDYDAKFVEARITNRVRGIVQAGYINLRQVVYVKMMARTKKK